MEMRAKEIQITQGVASNGTMIRERHIEANNSHLNLTHGSILYNITNEKSVSNHGKIFRTSMLQLVVRLVDLPINRSKYCG